MLEEICDRMMMACGAFPIFRWRIYAKRWRPFGLPICGAGPVAERSVWLIVKLESAGKAAVSFGSKF